MRRLRWLAIVPFLLFGALLAAVQEAATPPVPTQNAPKVIVVLGARVLPGGVASPALQARAEKAAVLFHQVHAEKIFFTGGVGRFAPSEAKVARDLAVQLGVPAEACVLEENSHTTAENAALTAPLLRLAGINRVLLVTDGFHLFRASALFRDAGFEVHPVASGRPMSAPSRAWSTLREGLAVLRRPWVLWS